MTEKSHINIQGFTVAIIAVVAMVFWQKKNNVTVVTVEITFENMMLNIWCGF